MNHIDFQIGFWHPFGKHSGESPEHILARKAAEAERNGWTLWSFAERPMRTLDCWGRQLTQAAPKSVVALCSAGRGRDPHDSGGEVVDCGSYRFAGEAEWRPMPSGIRVPHTFKKGKEKASAYIVRRVISPVDGFELPPVEWLRLDGPDGVWCQGFQQHGRQCPGIPSRPDFLIRRGGTSPMPPVRSILELMPPFLAIVVRGEVTAPATLSLHAADMGGSDNGVPRTPDELSKGKPMSTELIARCQEKLIEVSRRRVTITFGELAAHLGVHSRSLALRAYLNAVYNDVVISRKLPDLTLLAVYSRTKYGPYNSRGLPAQSVGFDPGDEKQRKVYDSDREKVYKHWA